MKRNIVKGIVKGILLFVPYYIFIVCFNLFPMSLYQTEYLQTQWAKQAAVSSHDSNKELVIIGDSTMHYGVVANEIGLNAINLSAIASSSIVSYYMLKEYIDNNNIPNTVVMGYSIGLYVTPGDFYDHTMKYDYLNTHDLIEAYVNASHIHDSSIGNNEYLKNLIQSKLKAPTKYSHIVLNSCLYTQERKIAYEKLEAESGSWLIDDVASHDDLVYINCELENFQVLPIVDVYIKKTIQLCNENQIHVILIQTPLNRTSYELMSDDVLQQFTDYMNELQNEYSNVIIENTIPVMDDRYYADSIHLNSDGAHAFTNSIKSKYFEK